MAFETPEHGPIHNLYVTVLRVVYINNYSGRRGKFHTLELLAHRTAYFLQHAVLCCNL